MTDSTDSYVFDDDYSFENFNIGPSNQEAWTYLNEVAEKWPIENYGPIVLTGTSGFGKTHLTTALTNKLKRKLPGLRIGRMSTEKFIYQLTMAIRAGTYDSFMAAKKFDVFVLEAAHLLAERPKIQGDATKFYRQFLADEERLVIFDVNWPLEEIQEFDSELLSLFQSAKQLWLKTPSSKELDSLARRKCLEQFDCNVPDDLITYILAKAKSSPRAILGLIYRVEAQRALSVGPWTFAAAKNLLIDQFGPVEIDP